MAGLRASAARCKDHRLATDVYVLRARCEFLQGCSRKPSFGVSVRPLPLPAAIHTIPGLLACNAQSDPELCGVRCGWRVAGDGSCLVADARRNSAVLQIPQGAMARLLSHERPGRQPCRQS